MVRILLVIFVTLCDQPANAQEYSLEQVTREYRKSLDAIDPVFTTSLFSTTYEKEYPEYGQVARTNDPVEWGIDGSKFTYHWASKNSSSWFSCDGKTTWSIDYGFANQGDDPAKPKCARKQSLEVITDSNLRLLVSPGKWLGLYFGIGPKHQSGQSVSSMLSESTAKFIGPERVLGSDCVRVNLVYVTLGGTEFPVHVWFDPTVGFLPRRIELVGESTRTHDVLEFREVSTSVYFPQQMLSFITGSKTIGGSLRETLELQKAILDQPLTRDKIKPILPPGTPVYNIDDPQGQRKWQSFISGDTPEKKKARIAAMLKNRPPDKAPEIDRDMTPTIVAEPSKGWSWSVILFFVGLVILSLGWLQHSRS